MSKSVLVIDTPENCGKCKFISTFWCRATGDRRVPNNDVIPVWCPLKSLPKYKSMEKSGEYEYGEMHGWNRCIDEITGGNADD